MASANVELVQRIYSAWERGDFSGAGWAHPELEFVRVDGPAPGRWKGVEIDVGVRDMLSAWEDLRLAAEEFRELDGDRVLALASGVARGKRSGVQLRVSATNLFHITNGKVTRVVTYYDRDLALAELGLAG